MERGYHSVIPCMECRDLSKHNCNTDICLDAYKKKSTIFRLLLSSNGEVLADKNLLILIKMFEIITIFLKEFIDIN